MADEKPLYQDEHFEIDYHPEIKEAHFLVIGESCLHLLTKGKLEKLSRLDPEDLATNSYRNNSRLYYDIHNTTSDTTSFTNASNAFKSALTEHERRAKEWTQYLQ